MSSFIDDIKNDKKGIVQDARSLIIEQKLNKLFYETPNYAEEIRMLKLQAKQKCQPRFGLHASAILASDNEFCYREQVLSLFYKQTQGENVAIGLKRIFEEGNFIGEKWQRLFVRGGIGIPEDMDISFYSDKYDLSFTPDAIVVIAGRKYVVEIKSQNSFIFRKQVGHPGGMKQLKFYMKLTRIYDGFVLVEDKNTQEFKVLLAKHEEELIVPYMDRLKNIQIYKHRLLDKGKLVGRICEVSSCKRALKCNMRNACFNAGFGKIKLAEAKNV